MATKLARAAKRRKRQFRIRKKIKGIADCPRLSVFRSARHICVQAIDDVSGKTLASASTYEKEIRVKAKSTGNKDSAAAVGTNASTKSPESVPSSSEAARTPLEMLIRYNSAACSKRSLITGPHRLA